MDCRSKILVAVIAAAAVLPALLHAHDPTPTASAAATKAAGIPPETEKLFKIVCNNSDETLMKSCMSRLSQNPKAPSATTYKAVAVLAISMLADQARTALEIIHRAVNQSEGAAKAGETGRVVETCIKSFEDAHEEVASRESDYVVGGGYSVMGNAMDYIAKNCEPNLQRRRGVDGKMIQIVNDQVREWYKVLAVGMEALRWYEYDDAERVSEIDDDDGKPLEYP